MTTNRIARRAALGVSLLLWMGACGNEPQLGPATLDPFSVPPEDSSTLLGLDSAAGGQDAGNAKADVAATEGEGDAAQKDVAPAQKDAAPAQDDAGAVFKDAQSGTGDGGAVEKDAGTVAKDAGSSAPDSGAGQVDAGSATQDVEAKPSCQDADKDGYGVGCAAGSDCDDTNPSFALVCPDCTKDNFPGCKCDGSKTPAANCFGGDPGWIGKGVCTPGVRLCKGGFWGACIGEVLPSPEICDGKDNNCNGLIDEGVLSTCGTCDMSCTKQQIGPDYGVPFDPGKDSSNGVGINKQGYVVLDKSKTNIDLEHIWIANHGEHTVSKLNTKTGHEDGRYATCPNPSRTAVDLNGDVWVACRGDGGVAKIINKIGNCVDKNGNGKIETSKDLNGDHKISGGELLPKGQDECVRFIVYPDEKKLARAAGVDKENYAWIGFWYTKRLRRLAPNTGAVVDTINLQCAPYGLVIDQKGIIWVAGRACKALERVDPKTKQTTVFKTPVNKYPYGINVDMFGRIWMASTSTFTWRFDPTTHKWDQVNHANNSRGVATSNDGHVYVANDGASAVAKINVVTLTKVGEVSLGPGHNPVGMAVDYDGFVWAINYSKSSATKINPKTMQIVGEYPVGKTPYTYSDMTGYTLNNYTAPKGHYTHVFGISGWSGTVDSSKTTTEWEQINLDVTTPASSYVKLRYRASNTFVGLKNTVWSKSLGPFPPMVSPLDLTKLGKVKGRYLQVEVFLQADAKTKASPVLKAISAKGKQTWL